MPILKFNSFARIVILLFICIFLINNTWAQTKLPDALEQYQKYFKYYVDNRSYPEKALNSIGLTTKDVGRSFTLIAGVYDYPNMPDLDRHLDPVKADINLLKEYLKNYEFFDEIVVLENQDVTLENLNYFLYEYFPKQLKKFPKSRFLFAYSGHGIQVQEREGSDEKAGYILKNTARNFQDTANAIPIDLMREMFTKVINSGYHVLVLINACYSGCFLKRPFESYNRFKWPSRYIS